MEFKILTDREHVRKRAGMYLGSTSQETQTQFILGEWTETQCVPALVKMVNEIIDNSLDEAMRTNYEFANEVSVRLDESWCEVVDNGRGIPQVDVIDTDGKKIPQPVAAWTKTKAGSNFEDNRTVIGANGVGSACTNFMSTKFVGKTWRDGQMIVVSCKDGAEHVDVETRKEDPSKTGTSVKFWPDMSLMKTDMTFRDSVECLIKDRLASLQVAFPNIRFKFNGKVLGDCRTLKKYAKMFSDHAVIYESDHLSFFLSQSNDNGHLSTSYVNGVNTRLGGSYNDYIANSICDELMDSIKRKHKLTLARANIKSGLTLVLFASGFSDPTYDSQTKERLTSPISAVKDHAGEIDFKAIARKIMNTDEIIEPIIEAQLAKKLAAEKRAATLAAKKLKKVRVAKHIAATTPDSTLAIVEGDSALGFLMKVRDPKKVGAYPLRGVIMNTWDMKPSEIVKNKELAELMSVLNLDITDPNSVDNMSYQNIMTLTDADVDGIGHICPLLMAFFYRFWPRLFEEGRVHICRTPIQISTKGKDLKWFFSFEEANNFKRSSESKGYYHRYIKGLASHTEEEYSRIINEPKLDTISIDDGKWFEIAYGKDVQKRKDWMMGV